MVPKQNTRNIYHKQMNKGVEGNVLRYLRPTKFQMTDSYFANPGLVRAARPHVLAGLGELQVLDELRQELDHDPLAGEPVDALEGRARPPRPRVARPADRVADHAHEHLASLFE